MGSENTPTFPSTSLSDKAKLIWCVLYIIESFLIVTMNAIAFKIFTKKQFVAVKSCYLIINMTFVDILVGVGLFFGGISTLFLKERNWAICSHPPLLQLVAISARVFAMASLLSMTMLAIERAISVFCPIKHRNLKNKHFYIAISLSWGLVVLTSVQVVDCDNQILYNILQIYVLMLTAVSILTIAISYSAIAIKMLYLPKNISNFTMKMNIKLSKTLLITTLVALINWGPSSVILALIERGLVSDNITYGMEVQIAANSLANLVVYTIRMPRFRRELLKVFKYKKSTSYSCY